MHTRVMSASTVGRTQRAVVGPRRATSATQYPTTSSLAASPAPLKPAAAADGYRGPGQADRDEAGGSAHSGGDMQAVLAALAKENTLAQENSRLSPSDASQGGRGASGGGARAASESAAMRPFPRLPSAKKLVAAPVGASGTPGAAAGLPGGVVGFGSVSVGAVGAGDRGMLGGLVDLAAAGGVGGERQRQGQGETVDESALAARLRMLDDQKQALLLSLLDQMQVPPLSLSPLSLSPSPTPLVAGAREHAHVLTLHKCARVRTRARHAS